MLNKNFKIKLKKKLQKLKLNLKICMIFSTWILLRKIKKKIK